jgi:hypothetical protein
LVHKVHNGAGTDYLIYIFVQHSYLELTYLTKTTSPRLHLIVLFHPWTFPETGEVLGPVMIISRLLFGPAQVSN